MNGYDLSEMVQRWWYLNSANPMAITALKVAGVCFLVALVSAFRGASE
jgi:hypothetical protein